MHRSHYCQGERPLAGGEIFQEEPGAGERLSSLLGLTHLDRDLPRRRRHSGAATEQHEWSRGGRFPTNEVRSASGRRRTWSRAAGVEKIGRSKGVAQNQAARDRIISRRLEGSPFQMRVQALSSKGKKRWRRWQFISSVHVGKDGPKTMSVGATARSRRRSA